MMMNRMKLFAIILSISIFSAYIFTNFIFPKRGMDKFSLEYKYISLKDIPSNKVCMVALPKDFDCHNLKHFSQVDKYISRIAFLDENVGIIIGFPFKVDGVEIGETRNLNKTIIIKITYGSGLPGLLYLNSLDEEYTLVLSIKNGSNIIMMSVGGIKDRVKCIEVYGKVVDENGVGVKNIPIKLYAVMHIDNITDIRVNLSKYYPFITNRNLTSILFSDEEGFFYTRIFSPAYAPDTVFLFYINNSTDGYYVISNNRNVIYQNITLIYRGD